MVACLHSGLLHGMAVDESEFSFCTTPTFTGPQVIAGYEGSNLRGLVPMHDACACGLRCPPPFARWPCNTNQLCTLSLACVFSHFQGASCVCAVCDYDTTGLWPPACSAVGEALRGEYIVAFGLTAYVSHMCDC